MSSALAHSAHHSPDSNPKEVLRAALAHATHLLPAQGPIGVFVHHNTLHAFQHLPFDKAVVKAAGCFGTEPYESEDAFAAHIAAGRITSADIAAVVAADTPDTRARLAAGLSQESLRVLRLMHPLERVEGAALHWWLHEGGALYEFEPRVSAVACERILRSAQRLLGGQPTSAQALSALYARLLPHAGARTPERIGPRPRDRILAKTGRDIDAWIQPILMRVCAAFVDQGIAYWSMPLRENGLLQAFRALYAHEGGPGEPWRRGLSKRLSEQAERSYDAERTAIEALQELRVPLKDWPEVIEASLRSLPGWAGMIAQLETRPDSAPTHAPPARLMDYLSLCLLLEAQAVAFVEQADATLEADDPIREPNRTSRDDGRDLQIVYEAFVMAQLAGVGPAELDTPEVAAAFVKEVADFGSVARRRLWHLAYERHHRHMVLDGMLAHAELGCPAAGKPRVQAVFCIDEREESLRRHLEEHDPSMETVGYAGFFGVAMAYQGQEDLRPHALCPVVVRPRHRVVEEVVDQAPGAVGRRRALGAARHATHVATRTAVRGGALTAILGLAAVVPLVARVLFPRFAERLSHSTAQATLPGPKTRLRIERNTGDDTLDAYGLLPGYTVEEMADIVQALIRTCGFGDRLAELVVIVGHGSSSMNNPHESAHDCGATGGGRGGPNARAFAAMANHPGVRALLSERGLALGQTVFIGAYHNTCDDAVLWFDADLVPERMRAEFERVQQEFERARRFDAHERCRRFESAPLHLDPERALAHVEGRAVNLGEPRPEYGHATNAVCIVGRRQRTRGLFLDRRAFLVSYDPLHDADGELLGQLLSSVGPVGAGINLEYYFSFVDSVGYGCGTKLPHNITGLVGVMDGHASDLRTGLPWQMVEIHEPVRLLTIVEAEPATLEALLSRLPAVRELVVNRWIQVVAWSPSTGKMSFFGPDGFVPHEPGTGALPSVETSRDYYQGKRGHLACARIESALHVETVL